MVCDSSFDQLHWKGTLELVKMTANPQAKCHRGRAKVSPMELGLEPASQSTSFTTCGTRTKLSLFTS